MWLRNVFMLNIFCGHKVPSTKNLLLNVIIITIFICSQPIKIVHVNYKSWQISNIKILNWKSISLLDTSIYFLTLTDTWLSLAGAYIFVVLEVETVHDPTIPVQMEDYPYQLSPSSFSDFPVTLWRLQYLFTVILPLYFKSWHYHLIFLPLFVLL